MQVRLKSVNGCAEPVGSIGYFQPMGTGAVERLWYECVCVLLAVLIHKPPAQLSVPRRRWDLTLSTQI